MYDSKTLIWIDKAIVVHNTNYDYKFVRYKKSINKVAIICTHHGIFWQRARDHLRGKGCNICGKLTSIANRTNSKEEFITQAILVHDDRYDYSHSVYTNMLTKMTIYDNHRDEYFEQTPANHLSGHNSINDRNSKFSETYRKNTEWFINKATVVHDGFFNYDDVAYMGSHNMVWICCPDHGNFSQMAYLHIQGQGCPKCVSSISKISRRWLDAMNVPDNSTHREVNRLHPDNPRWSVDGYDPVSRTIYEFMGDYWHGNPDIYKSDDVNPSTKTTYGELYEKTNRRLDAFRAIGFKVIIMWENDYVIGDSNHHRTSL